MRGLYEIILELSGPKRGALSAIEDFARMLYTDFREEGKIKS